MKELANNSFMASKKLNDIEVSLIRRMNTMLGPETINLGIGQMDFDPPSALIKEGIKAFQDKKLQYTENAGLIELRKLIASQYGIKDPDTVVVTSGAEQALYNVISAFLDPGDEVIIPEISYPAYEAIVGLNYGKISRFKLNKNLEPDLADIEAKITDKTKLLIINSPSNPSGVDYSSLYPKISKIVNRHDNCYILSDEVYSSLYLQGLRPDSIVKYSKKAILVDSISKRSSATGLRVGWSLAPKNISKEILKIQQYVSTCACSTSQRAAIAVIGKCSKDESKYREILSMNCNFIIETFSKIKNIKFVKPTAAFYFFPDISHYGKSFDVSKLLLEKADVLTIPGKAFGEAGDKFIRISFAIPHEKLKLAVSRIKEVLS